MREMERPHSPKESLRISIEEMKDMRKGIIPKEKIEDLLQDIEKSE